MLIIRRETAGPETIGRMTKVVGRGQYLRIMYIYSNFYFYYFIQNVKTKGQSCRGSIRKMILTPKFDEITYFFLFQIGIHDNIIFLYFPIYNAECYPL